MYGSGEQNIPNRYARWLKKIMFFVSKTKPTWHPYSKAVASYVHWGQRNCTLPSPKPVFVGYGASSPSSFGNGGNFHCFPQSDPELTETVLDDNAMKSEISGLLFETAENVEGQVGCAFCRLENATVVFTVSGKYDCPSDTKLEYIGFLMTVKDGGTSSAMLCLDSSPEDESNGKSSSSSWGKLVPIWVEGPTCEENERQFVPCAVCSR